jgi:hypothetical protein
MQRRRDCNESRQRKVGKAKSTLCTIKLHFCQQEVGVKVAEVLQSLSHAAENDPREPLENPINIRKIECRQIRPSGGPFNGHTFFSVATRDAPFQSSGPEPQS